MKRGLPRRSTRNIAASQPRSSIAAGTKISARTVKSRTSSPSVLDSSFICAETSGIMSTAVDEVPTAVADCGGSDFNGKSLPLDTAKLSTSIQLDVTDLPSSSHGPAMPHSQMPLIVTVPSSMPLAGTVPGTVEPSLSQSFAVTTATSSPRNTAVPTHLLPSTTIMPPTLLPTDVATLTAFQTGAAMQPAPLSVTTAVSPTSLPPGVSVAPTTTPSYIAVRPGEIVRAIGKPGNYSPPLDLASMQDQIRSLQAQLHSAQSALQVAMGSSSAARASFVPSSEMPESSFGVNRVGTHTHIHTASTSHHINSVDNSSATAVGVAGILQDVSMPRDRATFQTVPADTYGASLYPGLEQPQAPTTHNLPPLFAETPLAGVHDSRSVHAAKVLIDLPEFRGAPEDWPMFMTAYHQSTAVYRYSNFENCLRLQKSLKGEARDCVQSLLIHPDNVSAVIEQLKFHYGRPEVLIRSQLQQIRSVMPIADNNLARIIPFATKTQNLVAFLRAAAAEQHLWNPTLLEELTWKLPLCKRLEWAQYAASLKPYASLVDFSKWLKGVADIVSVVYTDGNHPNQESKRKVVLHTAEEHRTECPFCQGHHRVAECKDFLAWKIPNRWKEAKKRGLCFGCLKSGHMLNECSQRKPCAVDKCQRKHHKLLHERKRTARDSRGSTERIPSKNGSPAMDHSSGNEAVLSCVASAGVKSELLFRVVPIVLYGPNSRVETYALFDEGSSVTMMDSCLVRELGLQGRKSSINLSWYAGKSTQEKCSVVDLHISGIGRKTRYILNNVYGVPNLSLPTQSFNKAVVSGNVRDLPIASYSNARPRILIGLDHCHLGLAEEVVMLSENGPYAANTPLGWTVYGRTEASVSSSPHSCLLTRVESETILHDLVASYFETENFGVKLLPTVESKDDVRAKQLLKENTVKVDDRYQTGLLWRTDDIELPDSYQMALNRLLSIERKMKRNTEFAAAYKNIITDYVFKNYARKLSPEEANIVNPKTWYLPHFAVYNPNKPGKVRLVFDAAAAVDGISLNTKLLKGPQNYKPMPSVLFNFRIGAVGVCGDIKEMFHQVLISPEDRCSQRFLWRDADENRSPEVYEMQVMTFGAACSPCAAHYVKVTNAAVHHDKDPRAIKSILDFHYVDDLVDSFDTSSRAIEIVEQVRDIHKAAGFELRNFSSNSSEVVDFLEGKLNARVDFNADVGDEKLSTEKVLGIYWQPASDTFRFSLQFHRIKPDIIHGDRLPTKRELLSVFMSVFDPLGFLCHFMINAKLIMREVWKLDVRWDEPLPEGIRNLWNCWRQNLDRVVTLKIPRHYFRMGRPHVLELHTFVDASTEAFAAATYWRSIHADGMVEISFVCAKTKCAPPKPPMTVPNLELQAAVLGTRLMSTVLKEHNLRVARCILWSDSSTVIRWIGSESRRYKPFVAHRITEILESTSPSNWRWLPSRCNAADDATRMKCQMDFDFSSRWFQGPSFPLNPEHAWPQGPPTDTGNLEEDEELRPKYSLLAIRSEFISFCRFSSYEKLRRTTAWMLRFVRRCQGNYCLDESYGLTAEELSEAELLLCQISQEESFAEEISQLIAGDCLSKSSELYTLTPYVDSRNVLRVYGRIDAATWLPLDTKRPIILAPGHPLTRLIIAYYHKEMKHQNFEATICEIRRKFWIPRLRRVLREIVGRCSICQFLRAQPVPPLMGSLPEDRLTPYVRPFSYTGLDYFGPITVTIGRRHEKRWVALFTCLTIRAIHLEVAFDLSTDACILAIRNFINRRGVPVKIRSDNGKNFVGADQEAKRFSDVFDVEQVQGELSSKGVAWEFNCPHNPAEGGAWERMVQCVKRVLRQTLKEFSPREHTLYSFLIEAENVVNSRPLTHLPVSCEEDEPLTPNHFLLGCANTAQTPSGVSPDQPVVLRKQWRISRQLRDKFWKRWIVEYLPTLTRRSKWCQRTKPVQIGDLVLICDPSVPRRHWKRGRVENIFKGRDDVIRRADVRTNTGVLRRPISKLAVLDIE